MIISKYVQIKINPKNIKYYLTKIDGVSCGAKVNINVYDIHTGSHQKVDVQCDICYSESTKPIRQYYLSYNKYGIYCCSPNCAQFKNIKTNQSNHGVDNIFQLDYIKEKSKQKSIERYGVEYHTMCKSQMIKIQNILFEKYGTRNPIHIDGVIDKMKETCLIKYGSDNYGSSELAKAKRIIDGRQIADEFISEFRKYTNDVRKLTNKNRRQLFKNWNGLDFYDREEIRNNLSLNFTDKKYPTIDHKIPIFIGYLNNIPVEEIANIHNLCITKRGINSSKSTNTSDIFINKLQIN